MVTNNGIQAAIARYCGIDDSNSMSGMIEEFYGLLGKKAGLDAVLTRAEQIKRQ